MEYWRENPLTRRFWRHLWGRQVLGVLGSRFALTSAGAFDMIVDLKDRSGVSRQILKRRRYDSFLSRWIEGFLPEGSCAVDLGANIGYWTVLMARRRSLRVVAFEPEPFNFRLLERNVLLNGVAGRTTLLRKAVGEQEGRLPLFKSEKNAGDHRLFATDSEARDAVDVEVTTLDRELSGVSDVSFIKMDIQGFEPWAIRGMKETFARNPGVVVLSEIWPEGLAAAGSDTDAYLDAMESYGFEAHWFLAGEERTVPLEREAFARSTLGARHQDVFFAPRGVDPGLP